MQRTISITAEEQKLFNVMLKVAKRKWWLVPFKKKVTLRVAGGWVRDRILAQARGLSPETGHDIDILVGGMSGATFADVLPQLKHAGFYS